LTDEGLGLAVLTVSQLRVAQLVSAMQRNEHALATKLCSVATTNCHNVVTLPADCRTCTRLAFGKKTQQYTWTKVSNEILRDLWL
jgi:hypothetical protein